MVSKWVSIPPLAVLGGCIYFAALTAPANAASVSTVDSTASSFILAPSLASKLKFDDELTFVSSEAWMATVPETRDVRRGVGFRNSPMEAATIPLPPAVWTGLSGLGGLCLLNALRGRLPRWVLS